MSTIVEFNCDCCGRLEYTQPKHSAALIAYDGGIYRGWQQFARALGLNKDTLIKRVERRLCLRAPVTSGRRRSRPPEMTAGDLGGLMARWR